MNQFSVQVLALIYAQVAEMEGMKAENSRCESVGHALAWPESAFRDVRDELNRLAGLLQQNESDR